MNIRLLLTILYLFFGCNYLLAQKYIILNEGDFLYTKRNNYDYFFRDAKVFICSADTIVKLKEISSKVYEIDSIQLSYIKNNINNNLKILIYEKRVLISEYLNNDLLSSLPNKITESSISRKGLYFGRIFYYNNNKFIQFNYSNTEGYIVSTLSLLLNKKKYKNLEKL